MERLKGEVTASDERLAGLRRQLHAAKQARRQGGARRRWGAAGVLSGSRGRGVCGPARPWRACPVLKPSTATRDTPTLSPGCPAHSDKQAQPPQHATHMFANTYTQVHAHQTHEHARSCTPTTPIRTHTHPHAPAPPTQPQTYEERLAHQRLLSKEMALLHPHLNTHMCKLVL